MSINLLTFFKRIIKMYTAPRYSRPKELVPAIRKDVDPLLYKMLSYCTPHPNERWISNLIQDLKWVKGLEQEVIEGNLLIWVGTKQETLFSAHMDIVGDISKANAAAGSIDLIELMEYPKEPEYYYGAKKIIDTTTKEVLKYEASTIGADDKVGCFILCKLIQKKVPGLYVFHVGEECGAIGSTYLAKNKPDYFKDLKRAIAYDRAGYTDVIGRQRGKQCASKEFTTALADALNAYTPPKVKFHPDITGTFTDTASYMDIIPECTNISCGYWNQHGHTEHFDYAWLRDTLLPAALSIKYDELPTVRDPKKVITTYSYNNNHYSRNENYPPYTGASNRQSWATVKETTPDWQIPLWKFEDGWVEGANPSILRKAVISHIEKNTYTPKERTEAAQQFWSIMEYANILEEEICALRVQIDMMTTPEQPSDEELAELAAKVKDNTPFVYTELEKKDMANRAEKFFREEQQGFNDPIPEQLCLPKPENQYWCDYSDTECGSDCKLGECKYKHTQIIAAKEIHLFDKKHLLLNLSDLCKRIEFQPILKDGPVRLAKRVDRFLVEINDEGISKNKIKKMNSMIWHMTYWLNTQGINLKTPDKELLNASAQYIIEHQEERGWLSRQQFESIPGEVL